MGKKFCAMIKNQTLKFINLIFDRGVSIYHTLHPVVHEGESRRND